jgi:hypothetical protein
MLAVEKLRAERTWHVRLQRAGKATGEGYEGFRAGEGNLGLPPKPAEETIRQL